MITDDDVKKLITAFGSVFATKEDLMAMEKRMDAKYATKEDLKEVRIDLQKTIDEIVSFIIEYSASKEDVIRLENKIDTYSKIVQKHDKLLHT